MQFCRVSFRDKNEWVIVVTDDELNETQSLVFKAPDARHVPFAYVVEVLLERGWVTEGVISYYEGDGAWTIVMVEDERVLSSHSTWGPKPKRDVPIEVEQQEVVLN